MTSSSRPPRRVSSALGVALALALALPAAPALASGGHEHNFQGEGRTAAEQSQDLRGGLVTPSAAAQAKAAALGAQVTWNEFGTPSSLLRLGGRLSGPSNAPAIEIARGWVSANADLFGLDAAELTALETISDSALYDAPDLGRVAAGEAPLNTDVGHVVVFRQAYAGVPSATGGLITVGTTAKGEVAYVSSSVTSDTRVTNSRTLSATAAWARAAADIGAALGSLSVVEAENAQGFTTYSVPNAGELQYTRPRALATPTDGVKMVWETVVLDSAEATARGEEPTAWIHFIDAETGAVLKRENRVEHFADGFSAAPTSGRFSGTTSGPGATGPDHSFIEDGTNGTITVGVATTQGDNDITIQLDYVNPNPLIGRQTVATQDVLGSPEVLVYSPSGGVSAGQYIVVIREFAPGPQAYAYEGSYVSSPVSASAGARPQWSVFEANPDLQLPTSAPLVTPRSKYCWDIGSNCDRIVGFGGGAGNEINNTASRFPWDVNTRTNAPTFTTEGNNADTAPSFASFLTPDIGAGTSPVALDRDYTFGYNNEWFRNSCNPANFVAAPNRNDIDAATVNLYVGHNRMHDWSYYLGFTERNYNFQSNNFGNVQTEAGLLAPGENDPEVGQSQAGAIGGGPTFQGRDNANQITLQDGIPGITNQYLWQPLQAGFYAPCVDGAYDFSVIGHEYGHGIQGRMVGGPDGGISGAQGGSMNESWSDLNAMEYLNEFGLVPTNGENPFAVGAYVTGEQNSGIRNYGMNDSPLNYSDIEYDGNGLTSPHADGEIWSATNFTIRQAMIAAYDREFPSGDRALQERCANGILPADECPGNRRWKQMVYDSYLLQQSATSMVTARNAMYGADMVRFGGANQDILADAFAQRGFGADATSNGSDDRNPVPSFRSERAAANASVTFVPVGVDAGPAPADMKVYVGDFEARANPAATVTGSVPATASFAAGTYEFIAVAPGFGAFRFSQAFRAGETRTVEVPMRLNIASATNGAAASGDGVGMARLIDDTEATNWASLGSPSTGKTVRVDLAGTAPQVVKQVQVSAALHGAEAGSTGDTGSQSRFSAVRQFEILSCNTASGSTCAAIGDFTSELVSSGDAFPGDRPRPTAPDLQLRGFDVPEFTATHVAIRVLTNQCTGGPLYQGAANPDDDPVNDPDCDSGRTSAGATGGTTSLSQANNVRIAELQVFSSPAPVLVADVGPTPVVPEAPLALLLPLGAAGVLALLFRRRRATV